MLRVRRNKATRRLDGGEGAEGTLGAGLRGAAEGAQVRNSLSLPPSLSLPLSPSPSLPPSLSLSLSLARSLARSL